MMLHKRRPYNVLTVIKLRSIPKLQSVTFLSVKTEALAVLGFLQYIFYITRLGGEPKFSFECKAASRKLVIYTNC